MPPTPVHHRLPRAGVDAITDAVTAFHMVSMAIQRPVRHETIVLLLDDARRGISIVVVSGTEAPDSVVEVVECLAAPTVHQGRVAAMVVASVRPHDLGTADESRRDVDRWLEMSDIAETFGVELLEWFIIGHDINCPRDLLGESPRW